MPMYCIVATDGTVGGTIGTFDAINTRNADIRLRKGTTQVVGLPVIVARTLTTAATAMMARIRITSADLGITNQDFAVGTAGGGGRATRTRGRR